MVGRYKYFNEEKGFGFITGEDGRDYFAHISEVKSVQLPYRGATAEFTPAENGKGLAAKQILVRDAERCPQFIQIGGTRIKLSDIREYHVGKEYSKTKKEVEVRNHGLDKLLWGNYRKVEKEEVYPKYCLYIYLRRGRPSWDWDHCFERDSEDEIKEIANQLDKYIGNASID